MNRWIPIALAILAITLLGASYAGTWAPIGVDEATGRAWTLNTQTGEVCMTEFGSGPPLGRRNDLFQVCSGR